MWAPVRSFGPSVRGVDNVAFDRAASRRGYAIWDLFPWSATLRLRETAVVWEDRSENQVSRHRDDMTLRVGDTVVLALEGLETLITRLTSLGYEVKGPVVRSGAIVPGTLAGVEDLPKGVHDVQGPGSYRLEQGDDDQLFDWAVGPSGWKAEFFPAHDELWRAHVGDGDVELIETVVERRPLALVGARPCEVAALGVLDRVLLDGAHRDTRYGDRRAEAFIAVVECASPSSSCFCASMGTGPDVEAGFDLSLTELDDRRGHRFLVRVGTARGVAVLEGVAYWPATDLDMAARDNVLDSARRRMVRHLDTNGLADVLERNLEHPRWTQVGRTLPVVRELHVGLSDMFLQRRPRRDRSRRRRDPSTHVGVVLQHRSLVFARWRRATDDAVALSPVDDPQALLVVGPVRYVWLRGLRSMYCVVSRWHRHHRRGLGHRTLRWRDRHGARDTTEPLVKSIDELVGAHPFVAGLSDEHRTLVAGCARIVSLDAGSMLCVEGEDADTFYPRVVEVTCRSRCIKPDAGPIVIETVGAGRRGGVELARAPVPLDVRRSRHRAGGRARHRRRVPSCEVRCDDPSLGFALLSRVSQELLERLQATRVRLLDLYGGPRG